MLRFKLKLLLRVLLGKFNATFVKESSEYQNKFKIEAKFIKLIYYF